MSTCQAGTTWNHCEAIKLDKEFPLWKARECHGTGYFSI